MNDSQQDSSPESTQPKQSQLPPSAPPKNNMILKAIIGILAFIAIAVCINMMLSGGNVLTTAYDQLDAIRKNHLVDAYNMNSKAFKEATSFEVFESYVNSNPILNNFKMIKPTDTNVKDNTAYLSGVIEGADHGTMKADYQFVKEDGKWKIEALRLSPIGTDTREATMQTTKNDGGTTQAAPVIHGIMTSDIADADGYVEETKTTLPRSAAKIYATVMIAAQQPDITVTAIMKHMPTGVVLGPVESKTTKTGNVLKAFSFTREKQLWPTGEYQLDISLSTGDKESMHFTIE